MKKITRISLGIALLLVLAVVAQPAQAACVGFPGILGTKSAAGDSRIMTPGWPAGYYNGEPYALTSAFDQSSITGVWWLAGNGDPTIGLGDDNGAFQVQNWLFQRTYLYMGNTYYYGGYIETGWGVNPNIDGCINNGQFPQCTCILLTQHAAGDVPRFALLAAEASATFDTFFDLSGNAPILLEEIPRAQVVSSTRDPATFDVDLSITAAVPAQGLYEKDNCDCQLGFRPRELQQTRDLAAPTVRDVASWGGAQNPTAALGATASFLSDCSDGTSSSDVYVATELVANSCASGATSCFSAPLVSEVDFMGRIQCGPTLAEPRPTDKDRFVVPKGPETGRDGGRGGRTGR